VALKALPGDAVTVFAYLLFMPRRPSRHVDSPAEVGRRLREAREKVGLSQRELAFEGCTAAYISRIEVGARVPSLQILREFGRRLGVSAEFLAMGDAAAASASAIENAELALRLGEDDAATTAYERLLSGSPTSDEEARALAGLGEIALRRGDHSEATRLLEEAMAGDLPLADRDGAAERLGRAYGMSGQFETAFALLERELKQAQERKDSLAVLRFSTLLANALLDSGNVSRAEELLGEALTIADQARDPVDRARVWWSQSRLHTLQQHPDIAARYARMAIDTLEASEQSGFAAVAYQLVAHIENDRGNGAEALALLDRGYPTVVASGNRFHEALFRLERARALLVLGEREEAGSIAMGTLALLREASPTDAGRAYSLLGDVFRELGESDRALEVYELAVETLPAADRYLNGVYGAMAELLEEQGHQAEALEMLKRALKLQAGARSEVDPVG
jgi:tetratricopeptide (TPR) repeat protein